MWHNSKHNPAAISTSNNMYPFLFTHQRYPLAQMLSYQNHRTRKQDP